MTKRLMILALLLMGTHSIANTPSVVMDPNRTIRIVGQIDGSVIERAGDLLALADQGDEDIYLLINSPGGMVLPGAIFLDAMNMVKGRGIKIKCVTTIMAASMAYSIYATCSERYATPNALLLYHPARVSEVTVDDRSAQKLADALRELNEELLDFLEEVMGMDRDRLEQTFRDEKLWTASKLAKECRKGFINVVTQITGEKLYSLY